MSSTSSSFYQKRKYNNRLKGGKFYSNASTLPITIASSTLDSIQGNNEHFNRLELDAELLFGCCYSDLLRALCSNSSIKHISISKDFVNVLSMEKARVLLGIVGRLPQLQSISIQFPDFDEVESNTTDDNNDDPKNKNAQAIKKKGSQDEEIEEEEEQWCYSNNDNKSNNKNGLKEENNMGVKSSRGEKKTSVQLLHSLIAKAYLLRSVEIDGLQIKAVGDEQVILDAFRVLSKLKKLHLHAFEVDTKTVDTDLLFDFISNLPQLQEFEIRMKQQQTLNRGLRFFTTLCRAPKLTSLVLWNLRLSSVQVSTICATIENSQTIERLEIWRCELGPTFGILIAKMVRQNKSLKTLVISHVGNFHASSGVVALSEALKYNSTLKNLILLNMGSKNRGNHNNNNNANNDNNNNSSSAKKISDNQSIESLFGSVSVVSEAIVHMMRDNTGLQSLSVTYDELSEESCLQLANVSNNNSFSHDAGSVGSSSTTNALNFWK